MEGVQSMEERRLFQTAEKSIFHCVPYADLMCCVHKNPTLASPQIVGTMAHPFSPVGGGSCCLLLFLHTYATLISVPLPCAKSLQPAIDHSHTCHDFGVDPAALQRMVMLAVMSHFDVFRHRRQRPQWDPGMLKHMTALDRSSPWWSVQSDMPTPSMARQLLAPTASPFEYHGALALIQLLFQHSHPISSWPAVPNIRQCQNNKRLPSPSSI